MLCHGLLRLRVPDHGKGFRVMRGCYLPDRRWREMTLAGWGVPKCVENERARIVEILAEVERVLASGQSS